MADLSPQEQQAIIASVTKQMQANFDAKNAAKEEAAKLDQKRMVQVFAVRTPGQQKDANAMKFDHTWLPNASKVTFGGDPVTGEFTEKQILSMKKRPELKVLDPSNSADKAQADALVAATKKHKVIGTTKNAAPSGATTQPAPAAPAPDLKASGVAPAAQEALADLKASKKEKKG